MSDIMPSDLQVQDIFSSKSSEMFDGLCLKTGDVLLNSVCSLHLVCMSIGLLSRHTTQCGQMVSGSFGTL